MNTTDCAAPELAQMLKRAAEDIDALISIGKRDLTNPKYDGYFESLRAFLADMKKELP